MTRKQTKLPASLDSRTELCGPFMCSVPSTPSVASSFPECFLYTGTGRVSGCIAVNPLKGFSPVLLARKQTQAAPFLAWWTADPEGRPKQWNSFFSHLCLNLKNWEEQSGSQGRSSPGKEAANESRGPSQDPDICKPEVNIL